MYNLVVKPYCTTLFYNLIEQAYWTNLLDNLIGQAYSTTLLNNLIGKLHWITLELFWIDVKCANLFFNRITSCLKARLVYKRTPPKTTFPNTCNFTVSSKMKLVENILRHLRGQFLRFLKELALVVYPLFCVF